MLCLCQYCHLQIIVTKRKNAITGFAWVHLKMVGFRMKPRWTKCCVKCEIRFWRLLKTHINVNFDKIEVNNNEKKMSTQNRRHLVESKYTALLRQIKLSATGSKNQFSKLSEIFSLCDSWRLISRISQKHIKCTKVGYTQIKFYIFWLNAQILIECQADADFKPFWKTFFDEFTNF